MDIRKKTVVVTGAGRGIGRAIAYRLARQGANLALFDLNAADLEETANLCTAESVQARLYRVNVVDEGEVCAAMTRVAADFGRLDGLVNNAGIVRDGLLVKVKDGIPVGRMTMEQWNSVIGVNLTGVFLCTREAAAHMIECGNGGVIVSISSISRAGNAGQTNYSAAKAGVESMGVVWAKELARYAIRVGTIAPGFTHTEILSAMRPEVLNKLTAPVPLKRLGQPDEIAHAVLFVFENDFFTGRCIEVDGGLRL
ncbi:MAG: SDR family oxidoreductase [Pseudomonadota bacterium]|nr:SDR family oxidoreductase [Pseudomonadota bacterium]